MSHENLRKRPENDTLSMRRLELDKGDGNFAYRQLRSMIGRAASHGFVAKARGAAPGESADLLIASDREGRTLITLSDKTDRRAVGSRIVPPTMYVASRIEVGKYAYLLRTDYNYSRDEFDITYATTDDDGVRTAEHDLELLNRHLHTGGAIVSAAIQKGAPTDNLAVDHANIIYLDQWRGTPE